MKTAEIRSRFLEYFKKKGHQLVPSSALVPSNDPTLLFTTAGMVQFKDVFLAKEKRNYTRAASVQKCVRAGGKHNDLENVGFTARHHTFFEMLGNFSFGDYFKEDAIRFAWEFATEELKLPKEKLYVSVYKDDEEAFGIWNKKIGLAPERISRFGEKDNFWSMGDTGPCGPCTELFVDRGVKNGCGKADCKMGCDCDRFIEFWNLVFMQYDRDEKGNLNPLPKPSVDTGAGLERIAAILQDVPTNYDTDGFKDIMDRTAKLIGKPYVPGTEDSFYFRVIADHSRAITFLISDGVMPSNEGRGYVLRRIIRRAVRYGRKLGFKEPFLHKTCQFVVDQMASVYPDLEDKRALVEKMALIEEEQFLRTLERGLEMLDDEMKKAKKSGVLPGEVAFRMYDTYGFPLDLTRVICSENELAVDEAGFEKHMDEQRAQSRKSWKGAGGQAVTTEYYELRDRLAKEGKLPKFVGYDAMRAEATCVAILPAGEGEEQAVFDMTPFYPEGGGQVGDKGRVVGEGFEAEVIDVQKPVDDLITVTVKNLSGSLKVGGKYTLETQEETRRLTMRNHTATHMLHWALRKVLGSHVKQAGSLVTPDMLRFDFAHFQSLTQDEVETVERLINEHIWAAHVVAKREMPKDDAVKAGAIAFFGEKYGDTVRVVSVGDFSTELCGGTHVDNTAEINLFKIVSEASIASGVRRIVAVTSKKAFEYLQGSDQEYRQVKERWKATSYADLEQKLDKMAQTEKELRRQLEKFEGERAGQEVETLVAQAQTIDGVAVIARVFPDGDAKKLRELGDLLRQKAPQSVSILGGKADGKAFLLAAVGKDQMARVPANGLIQELSGFIAGRGGGKPDMAQAGGTDVSGVEKAIAEAPTAIKKLLAKGS